MDPAELDADAAEWVSTLIEGASSKRADRVLFDERYSVIETVSVGSMGEVRRCRDRPLARDVAMKLLPPRGARVARWRFLREARVQAQLRHPNIVPVHDIGLDVDQRPYFTMEWIEGRSLGESLREGLSRARALDALRQTCRAVAHAHARGVVHRDLKPSNVRLDPEGGAYLLDWGLAKLRAEPAPAEEPVQDTSGAITTQDGAVLGTIGYMAPEQLRGEVAAIDVGADVYALGAMLFELLAGAPLHAGKRAQRALSILRTDGASPAARAPDRGIPAALDEACVTATRLDPLARAVSAARLAELLEDPWPA